MCRALAADSGGVTGQMLPALGHRRCNCKWRQTMFLHISHEKAHIENLPATVGGFTLALATRDASCFVCDHNTWEWWYFGISCMKPHNEHTFSRMNTRRRQACETTMMIVGTHITRSLLVDKIWKKIVSTSTTKMTLQHCDVMKLKRQVRNLLKLTRLVMRTFSVTLVATDNAKTAKRGSS